MDDMLAIKRNVEGKETWRYSGHVLERDQDHVIFEALFNRDDLPFHGVVLKRNDRFVETWYRERWYNIFEIHDRDDGLLKIWYCNVGKPVEFADGVVSYIDLALDLLVYPDGRQEVLDEDEFEALHLDEDTRLKALAALKELQETFQQKIGN
jgi:uncharacterized protein